MKLPSSPKQASPKPKAKSKIKAKDLKDWHGVEEVAGLEDIVLDTSEAAISSADEGEDEVFSDEEIEAQDGAAATKK